MALNEILMNAKATIRRNSSSSEEIVPPDGESELVISFTVFDQENKPLPGAKVKFEVFAVRPADNAFRTEDGVVNQYRSEKTKEKIRKEIRSGKIRLLGTMDKNEATSDESGQVVAVYKASHIGGNQDEIGQERVVASLVYDKEVKVEMIVNLGCDYLVPIPTVDGGLRIINSAGIYIHKNVATLLKTVGEQIKNEKWKIPITISAGTFKWGGLYPPHSAHRYGTEIDFWTMASDGKKPYKYTDTEYDREKTQTLVDIFTKAGATQILFCDPKVKGVKPYAGHEDHLHLSFMPKLSFTEMESNPCKS